VFGAARFKTAKIHSKAAIIHLKALKDKFKIHKIPTLPLPHLSFLKISNTV
jgi:hypothetical protein